MFNHRRKIPAILHDNGISMRFAFAASIDVERLDARFVVGGDMEVWERNFPGFFFSKKKT
jgi:hypothetical protein